MKIRTLYFVDEGFEIYSREKTSVGLLFFLPGPVRSWLPGRARWMFSQTFLKRAAEVASLAAKAAEAEFEGWVLVGRAPEVYRQSWSRYVGHIIIKAVRDGADLLQAYRDADCALPKIRSVIEDYEV